MEGGDETAASGSSATGALARLEEARAVKQELAAAQRAWTQEVGALVHEQEAAVDALLSELETCRSQMAMQREAMAAMEVRPLSPTLWGAPLLQTRAEFLCEHLLFCPSSCRPVPEMALRSSRRSTRQW